jgi:hypothetical protein
LAAVRARADDLIPKNITVDDIFSSINYFNNIAYGIGTTTTSTIWATAAFVPWASFCKTSSGSGFPGWKGSSGSA